jgi:putative DNA primase/helicase
MSARVDYAFAYACYGARVFPCHYILPSGECSCGTPDCHDDPKGRGKHPLLNGWQNEATVEQPRIVNWWRERPLANIGVACGKGSNLTVVDVDGAEGLDYLHEIESKYGTLPATPRCLTGSGGLHLCFEYTEGLTNKVRWASGMDIRTEGGLVIGAGSSNSKGTYEFEVGYSIGDLPRAKMPRWLVEEIEAGQGGSKHNGAGGKHASASADDGADIPHGKRDDTIFKLACRLRWAGLSFDEVLIRMHKVNVERCKPPLTDRRVVAKVESAFRYQNNDGVGDDDADPSGTKQEEAVITEMNEVEAEEVEWYWEPKIAAKKVTLLAGDPGLGKSFIALYKAAVISTGGKWIDGGTAPAGDTLLLSLEDDPADTIRPRLDALGADCSKIHLLTGVRKRVKGKMVEQMFDLNLDVPALDQALQQRPSVRLVIIDPISAYLGKGGLGGSNSHNNAEMRALLAPLSGLATKYHVAILAITHLNKAPAQVLYRVMGSLAFVALARATWFVVKDPNNPRRRLLMPSKNNIAADNGPGLAYRIQEDDQGRATIAWEPEPVTQSLEDVLVVAKKDSAKVTEAKTFIHAYLADGQQHLSAEIKDAALADGIAQRTYERAQADEIKAQRVELIIGVLKRRYLRKKESN